MFGKHALSMLVVGIALAALFVGISQAGEQESVVVAGKIIIPEEGLIFETEQGIKIAELKRDEYGGYFCVLNNQGNAMGLITAAPPKLEDLEDLFSEFPEEEPIMLGFDIEDMKDWMWNMEDRISAIEKKAGYGSNEETEEVELEVLCEEMEDVLGEYEEETEIIEYDLDDMKDWMWGVEDSLTALEESTQADPSIVQEDLDDMIWEMEPLVDEFDEELEMVGYELDDMKDWMWNIEDRVAAMEKWKEGVLDKLWALKERIIALEEKS